MQALETNSLEREIKELIVATMSLEDIGADDIETDAPLFNEGLGLDSIDALELGLARLHRMRRRPTPHVGHDETYPRRGRTRVDKGLRAAGAVLVVKIGHGLI